LTQINDGLLIGWQNFYIELRDREFGGYVIGYATDNLTSDGFKLDGMLALILFAVVVVYFVVGQYFGGTIWQRVLGARRV
jgi:hypothetical protein